MPTDVTLKLPDGSIEAHKMILAAVSPVFEKMFYGDFKEEKSRTFDLPTDNYKIIKLLVDLIYNGACKPNSLDDILPLNEMMDRYQMRKGVFYHMCGEVVLAQLNRSNYLTLLPKFVRVLNEESIKKAASKVMCYTSSNFVTIFNFTKSLPEEILLSLLQRDDIPNPELDIFNFLVNWHDYQTRELKKTLSLVSQLFQCIRYFLISPYLLHSKVAICSLVDKQTLNKAINCLYQNSSKVNDSNCKCGECNRSDHDIYAYGRFRCTDNIFTYWKPFTATPGQNKNYACTITYNPDNRYKVQFNGNAGITKFTQSQSLKNGTYVLLITKLINNSYHNDAKLSLCANANNRIQCLYVPIIANDFVTILVYNNDICFKVIDGVNKVSVYSATGTGPFSIDLVGMCSAAYSVTLEIHVF